MVSCTQVNSREPSSPSFAYARFIGFASLKLGARLVLENVLAFKKIPRTYPDKRVSLLQIDSLVLPLLGSLPPVTERLGSRLDGQDNIAEMV